MKTLQELATPITEAVERLQHAMDDAREAGCVVLLLIDAATSIGLPMPAICIERDNEAIWSGAWHLIQWGADGKPVSDEALGLTFHRR